MRVDLGLERGATVQSEGRHFIVLQALDFEHLLAQDPETGKPVRLAIKDVVPPESEPTTPAPDLSEIPGDEWDEANKRYAAIKPLLATERPGAAAVKAVADVVGNHPTTIYRWIRLFRSTGRVSSLLPVNSDGGKGKGRIKDEQTERIISETITGFYLTRRQPTVQATADEVIRLCREAGCQVPHANTVRNRINAVAEKTRLERRGHSKIASDRFTARPGKFEDAQWPLSFVQIDHTRLDNIAVDSDEREPIIRPWLTLAFDVYSRMVLGFYISLDPPGALATGLCIAHAILPKERWLAEHQIEAKWPCWGTPRAIHLVSGLPKLTHPGR